MISLLIVLLAAADCRLFHRTPNSPKKYCPPDFDYNDVDRCFRYIPMKKNYFSAELHCANLGSHLTSVRNMYDNAFISQQLPATPGYSWLGLTNQIDGSWRWVNGEPLAYTNWDPQSYPQTAPFNCSAINSTNTRWAVFDCSKEFTFICGVNATDSQGTSCINGTQSPLERDLCPSGFSIFSPTSSCYKMVRQNSYSQAKLTCQSYGAQLVTLTLKEEEDFLSELVGDQSSKTGGIYVCKMAIQ